MNKEKENYMRFRCVSCGLEFDDIQQLASHKKQHQSPQEEGPKGITCLNCAKKIILELSQYNYKGPLTCPHCRRSMTVTLQNGDVLVARVG
jgi:DNA-directed RNA polymerase subunit RPC12/RpoP